MTGHRARESGIGLRGQFLVFVLGALLLTGGVLFFQSRQSMTRMASFVEAEQRHAIEGMLVEIARSEAARLKDELENVQGIKALKTLYGDRSALADHFYPILNRLHKGGIRRLTFYDEEGKVYLKAHDVEDRTFPAGRMLPGLALRKDQVVSGIEYDGDEFLQFVVAPYYIKGKRIGVLEIGGDVGRVVEVLKQLLGADGALLLRNGSLVNPTAKELLGEAAGLGKEARFTRGGQWYASFRIPVPGQEASFLIVTNTTRVQDLLARTRSQIVVQFAGILLVVIVLVVVVTGLLLKPLQAAISAVEAVAKQDLSVDLHPGGSGEVAALTAALNRMVSDLRGILHRVNGLCDQLASLAESVSSVTEETTASIEEVTASTQEVLRGTQEEAEQVQQVSAVIREMGSVIDLATKTAEANRQATEEAAKAIVALAAAAAGQAAAPGSMDALREAVERSRHEIGLIGTVVQQLRSGNGVILTSIDKILKTSGRNAGIAKALSSTMEDEARVMQDLSKEVVMLTALGEELMILVKSFKLNGRAERGLQSGGDRPAAAVP